jgi:site-specific DNA-methyltransferase (adenine-specific)
MIAKLRIEYVAPAKLRPNPENPRRIDKASRERLGAGLERFGWLGPIVARKRDRLVLGGHQRLSLALERGEARVPVVYVDGLSDNEARAVTVLLNNPAAQGEWDEAKLEAFLAQIPRKLLRATGFGDEELQELAAHFQPDGDGRGDQADLIPAVPLSPKSEAGVVYELGPHRLLCGDATVPESLVQLMGERRADMFLTDPPYGIYGSSTGLGADVTDDKIIRPFFREVLLAAKRTTVEFAHVYVFCDWRSWASWWEMAKQAGLKVKNCIVWDKGDFGMGANYPNAHEFILFAANLAPDPTMTSKRRTGQRQVLDQPNILRFPRASGADRQHNAAKPVALLSLLIDKGCDPGGVVLDPYAGSGSTIVAAERTGRIGYGVEIDPKWCDVARQRYADLTGDPQWSPVGRVLTKPLKPVVKSTKPKRKAPAEA